jgi:hypothetical protein
MGVMGASCLFAKAIQASTPNAIGFKNEKKQLVHFSKNRPDYFGESSEIDPGDDN